MHSIPVIDLSDPDPAALDAACRAVGFFTVVGHGVPADHLAALDAAARAFFARPEAEKQAIEMAVAGPAWRGWFPVGGELTSGVPDGKEGIYFGAEGEPGVPLHGRNLFPADQPELRDVVLRHLDLMTDLAHRTMRVLAVGLGLDPGWFEAELTADPTILFRIFHYPPAAAGAAWGVAEHTDYGLLTILGQDGHAGLEVHGPDGWIAVPPDPEAFVCNIGDMLEAMTGGAYRSTPHRVTPPTASRLSFPFFFDPSWDAVVRPVPGLDPTPEHRARWDGADPLAFDGTYGEYLTAKVAKVFPRLFASLRD